MILLLAFIGVLLDAFALDDGALSIVACLAGFDLLGHRLYVLRRLACVEWPRRDAEVLGEIDRCRWVSCG